MEMEINSGDLQDAIEAVDVSGREEAVMVLHDDSWVIKSRGPANVIMAAVLMPERAMKSYDKGRYELIGLPTTKLDEFLGSRDDTVAMWMEKRALHVDDGGTHARLATIDPDIVDGHMEGSPSVEYEVSFNSSVDVIKDFANKADNLLTTGSYFLSARNSGLYLYAEGDNGQLDRHIPWDEFDSHHIDWSVDNEGPEGSLTPSVHEGTDVILAIDFTQELKKIDDNSRISIGNHQPLKILFDKSENGKEGMKVTFIQTPRTDMGGDNSLPDKVVKQYGS